MNIRKQHYFVLVFFFFVVLLVYYWQLFYEQMMPYSKYDKSMMFEFTSHYKNAPNDLILNPNRASERFGHRLEDLNEVCRIGTNKGIWSSEDISQYSTKWIPNENFVVSPKNNLLLCVVPKCGSNTWHSIIYLLNTGKSDFTNSIRYSNNEMAVGLSPSEGQKLVTDAKTFRGIITRHPFARLISAWHEKFKHGETFGVYLMKMYPKINLFVTDEDKEHIITFAGLMKYIARYGNDPSNLDYHFSTTTSLCDPCYYPYNGIIKMEALPQDQDWIKEKLNIKEIPNSRTTVDSNLVDFIRKHFTEVPKSTIEQLLNIYHLDFVLFGYTFDISSLTAGGFY